MDWGLVIAALAFLATVTTILAYWRRFEVKRAMQDRLRDRDGSTEPSARIFRESSDATDLTWKWLTTLIEQAGCDNMTMTRVLLLIVGCAVIGGATAAYRTGGVVITALSSLVVGSLPLVYLLHKRRQRFQQFEIQFPDALDMMTRSIRAGHAFSGAIGLVGEEMPDPAGQEFRRVFEEIRLGLDPSEALLGIQRRVPIEDTGFFCTAINIQRVGGGNLAEILDRLAEVIRERFKLLKHAQVLSTQHRWTAICVGLSPFIFALIFELTNPGYFDPLVQSPHAPFMLTAGLVLEVIGFFMIWRVAQIKV